MPFHFYLILFFVPLSIYSSFKMFFLMNPETVSKTTKRIPPLFVYETVSVTHTCIFCFIHLPRTQSQNLGQETSVQGCHTNHTMLAHSLRYYMLSIILPFFLSNGSQCRQSPVVFLDTNTIITLNTSLDDIKRCVESSGDNTTHSTSSKISDTLLVRILQAH